MSTANNKPFASAVILAAGEGKRAGNSLKQFALLGGVPVLAKSLRVFAACPAISEIVITAPENKTEEARKIAEKWTDGKAKIIIGGKTRFESARLGFYATNGEAVVFHDSARPFVDAETIENCIGAAIEFGAATAAVALDDSIKKTERDAKNPSVLHARKAVERKGVWRVQTPQAFRRDLLGGAYENFSGNPEGITDETALFEGTENPAVIVASSKRNMKITTSADFALAEIMAENTETEK